MVQCNTNTVAAQYIELASMFWPHGCIYKICRIVNNKTKLKRNTARKPRTRLHTICATAVGVELALSGIHADVIPLFCAQSSVQCKMRVSYCRLRVVKLFSFLAALSQCCCHASSTLSRHMSPSRCDIDATAWLHQQECGHKNATA